MAQRRPYLYFIDAESSNREIRNGRTGSSYNNTFLEFSTYRELVKAVPTFNNDTFTVYRSRRGQWGEWFEKWEEGKIVEEGWM
jgi:hypothetical protein